MGFFDKFLKKSEKKESTISDNDIVAIADGIMFDISTVPDELFAQKVMGDGVAFRYTGDKVTLCAPVNGTLTVLFPTKHAYGMTAKDGMEILVHCGINTAEGSGEGFKLYKHKQGDFLSAGTPILEVDLEKLSNKYDMSTMLIITNPNERKISFTEFGAYIKGQSIIK